MGTDLRAHLEVFYINLGWCYYAPVEFMRDYKLQTRLGGPRSYEGIEPMAATNKGLPDDITFITWTHLRGHDSKYRSWLSYNEIASLLEFIQENGMRKAWGSIFESDYLKMNSLGVWLYGNDIMSLKEPGNDFPSGLKDIRLIYWFE